MTVKDYAIDTNNTVASILKKCQELGISVKNPDDVLSDDDVIILDNTIDLISTENENTIEEKQEIEDKVDELIESSNFDRMVNIDTKPQKIKRKKVKNDKDDFKKKRKEMYKNKNKLQSNESNDENTILYHDNITVKELADLLGIKSNDIIIKLMSLGLMVTVNQVIDYDNAEIIALEYGKKLAKEETADIANFEEFEIVDKEENLKERPPVVTIMGHVDHGKTTLLDYIRSSHIVSTESGGITQAIGAYQIDYNQHKITFIDTPGHAAFTEMRARGASVTDIVIIIVAADDGVMPQTKEAIDHALAANVPIIVAVNKIDKKEANIDRILTEMADNNIIPESWGGKIPFVNISAKTGQGVELLLDTILAISEVSSLKANPDRYASGTVIESKADKKIGSVASLLIQSGTLRIGDPIVVGSSFGHVRTMKNDLGEQIVSAGPSMPVFISGISSVPEAGDKFMAFESDSKAKEVAAKRELLLKEKKNKKQVVSLDDLFDQIKSGIKEINVVLKCDVSGSCEAVKNSLEKIDVEGVKVKVIRSGVGTITESDVVLANASNAIIIGFNVSPANSTKDIAKEYGVDIRLYTIIYKLVEEMEMAMKGLLDPEYEEQVTGNAEVRQLFKFSKVGTIAGSHVISGLIKSSSECRLIRDGKIIFTGKIASIQREKDQVKEVKKGLDCGITLENYDDIKVNDIIETYEMVEIKHI